MFVHGCAFFFLGGQSILNVGRNAQPTARCRVKMQGNNWSGCRRGIMIVCTRARGTWVMGRSGPTYDDLDGKQLKGGTGFRGDGSRIYVSVSPICWIYAPYRASFFARQPIVNLICFSSQGYPSTSCGKRLELFVCLLRPPAVCSALKRLLCCPPSSFGLTPTVIRRDGQTWTGARVIGRKLSDPT